MSESSTLARHLDLPSLCFWSRHESFPCLRTSCPEPCDAPGPDILLKNVFLGRHGSVKRQNFEGLLDRGIATIESGYSQFAGRSPSSRSILATTTTEYLDRNLIHVVPSKPTVFLMIVSTRPPVQIYKLQQPRVPKPSNRDPLSEPPSRAIVAILLAGTHSSRGSPTLGRDKKLSGTGKGKMVPWGRKAPCARFAGVSAQIPEPF